MPFKNPEDKARYYRERGPAYRAAKAEEIKARQKKWYQENKERLRLKDQENKESIYRRVRQRRRAVNSTGALQAVQVVAQAITTLDSTDHS